MSPLFQQIIPYALLPTLALTGGGLVALFVRFGVQVRSAILHFAAGVVFSVVAVEILPDVVRLHDPVLTAVGFGAGIGLMLLIRRLTQSPEEATTKVTGKQLGESTGGRFPIAFLLAIGVDIFIDGLLLGIGFAAGAKEGVLLAFALAVEVLSLGLATATSLTEDGVPRSRIIRLLLGLSSLFFVSTVGGATLLHNLPETGLDVVLSFGLAALLFLVTEELLVEAHEGEEKPWLTATFFAGFLLFLILGMVA
ncbi:zinc transporter, ZIP family (plasmid) [Fibrella aestuarina BUZ 2]|uniref:Zinc transporter, ZIP family n=1 Tax=Fibrella aestuarina BUZ 2 TaxID=1166018 RepID=I0KHL0_9BACT|nr:zinc transporter ZIP family [Fibrella aestuarina]CCH03613.1 zinc transporter, ZIP family [Fibrella aestuarina BUZ 2]